MGAWHNTYADLLRTRFSALIAYANLLVPDPVGARELAQDSALAVFSKRRTPRGTQAAELAAREWMATHAPDATQAAIVLQAIDAKDPAGVKAVLRKATPDLTLGGDCNLSVPVPAGRCVVVDDCPGLTADSVLVVKGAVPGPNGGYVVVRRAKR